MKALHDIWTSFKFPGEILAVQWHLIPAGESWSLARLKRKGEEVELLETRTSRSSGQLLENMKSLPVFLLVTGNKVLAKKLKAGAGEKDPEDLLLRAFPNVNQDELVFATGRAGEAEDYVSAIRRTYIEELLQSWPAQFPLLDLVVGMYPLWPLLSKLGNAELELGGHRVNVERAEIIPAELQNKEIEVFGENLPSVSAGAFLLGIYKFSTKAFDQDLPELVENQSGWRYGRLYQTGLVASISGIFLVLLLSFGLFSYYSEQTGAMTVQARAYEEQNLRLQQLRDAYDQKEQFLAVNGGQSSKTARMADEVARHVPERISLQRMVFHPVEKRLKRENLVRFSRNHLLINGETGSYSHFRDWLSDLKELDWVESVEILGYEETGSRHHANFAMRLMIKE